MIFQWPSFQVDLAAFNAWLKINVPNADGINASSANFEVVERTPFTSSDTTTVQNYYNALTAPTAAAASLATYTALINASMSFGIGVQIQFAAENVQMGITQAGLTDDVLQYLGDVENSIASGSLKDAINKIDALVAAGVPSNLAPFCTTTRLNQFRNQMAVYVGVPTV